MQISVVVVEKDTSYLEMSNSDHQDDCLRAYCPRWGSRVMYASEDYESREDEENDDAVVDWPQTDN